jgi:hypothetical protein
MTATGVYIGNYVEDLQAFDAWLGSKVQMVGLGTGRASWADWDGSIGWLADMWQSVDVQIRWTIPMFANEGNLASAGAGEYNSHYLAAAQTLANTFSNQSQIIIRVGEEFNGDWMPWSAQGHPQDYINAFRDFVDVFRSVSNKFVFEWNTNVGDVGMNPETAYPGDKYVDIIGTDFYYNQWSSSDPTVAWNDMVNQPYGLQWLVDFAAAHGKPTAYSEWGVESNNVATYIDDVARWFAAHDPLYQIYWNSNDDFAGDLSHGQYPATAAAYLKDFGPPPVPGIASISADANVIGGGITNVSHVTLTGTAGANETVQIFDGTVHIATLTSDGNGAWSFSTETVVDGSHTFTSVGMNLAGNLSVASSALPVTIDAVLTTPSVTIGGGGNDAFVFHQPACGNSGSPNSFVLDGFASKVESCNLLALVNEARSDHQLLDAAHDIGFGHPGSVSSMNAHFAELHVADFMIH